MRFVSLKTVLAIVDTDVPSIFFPVLESILKVVLSEIFQDEFQLWGWTKNPQCARSGDEGD